MNKKEITIVGAGPAGLFSAYLLLKNGYKVNLYDHSSGAAKKFLVAGNGGLNLTHSEDLESFSKRYGKDGNFFKELINDFSPSDLRNWCHELGVETFVGSSGRVFPVKLKAAEILLNWLKKLKSFENFNLHLNHSLIDISPSKKLTFNHESSEVQVEPQIIILALGGASWSKTGSTGKWMELISKLGITVHDFTPSNCGFEIQWSDYYKKNAQRMPLKNIEIHFDSDKIKGEAMLTSFGIEGGAIYALSKKIREEIEIKGSADIFIDLKPDLSEKEIIKRIKLKQKKVSLSNHLRKSLNFNKGIFILLKEVLPDGEDSDYAHLIKNFKLTLVKARPIDEAISTGGGICFKELSSNLELKKLPQVYIAGEMLDFEAPTGGYLLQACFSTAFRIVKSILSP